MNNNGERINKYNELLIGFLNNLVNELNPANEEMVNLINEVTINFKKQLDDLELDIADNGIKTLLGNAFNEYIKLLKYHFDHSNIHRIDISHAEDENINYEVNQVTNNLTNAVNEMNKLPEYQALINSIKSTLVNYFIQTFPNKENVNAISEEIVTKCIISFFTGVSNAKAEEFYSNTLPTLISLTNEIVYVKPISDEDLAAIKLLVNDERDAFIYETMDVEIKEGFENGVVTLEVTDSMGKTTLYEGREAMEKLVSYNQLFEASRPGKKADISKWEHLLKAMYEEDAKAENNPVEVNTENTNFAQEEVVTIPNDNLSDVLPTPQSDVNLFEGVINSQVDNNPVIIAPNEESEKNENSDVDDLLNKMNHTMGNSISNSYNPMQNVNLNNKENSNINIDNNIVNSNAFMNNNVNTGPLQNNNEQVIKNFLSQHEANSASSDLPLNVFGENTNVSFNNSSDGPTLPLNISGDGTNATIVGDNNNTNNNDFSNLANSALNSMINATQQNNNEDEESNEELNEIKSMIGLKEDVKPSNDTNAYGSSFSFLPNFNTSNQERNDFIKKATGITIEEDVDHQGELYLKVTEPTGREQIYTGKEAVNMIRNYNRTYLDANPDKKVDTSLIDKFD